jgi:hypothetical protein
MSTRRFSHVYTDGPLIGTGVWQFESEWCTAGQRLGWRRLEWRGRHEGDAHWRRQVVETDHRISLWTVRSAHEHVVRQHIFGSFALGESCRAWHRTFLPSSTLTAEARYLPAIRPTVYGTGLNSTGGRGVGGQAAASICRLGVPASTYLFTTAWRC